MMMINKGCACVNNICHSVRVWVWECIVNGKVNIDCIDHNPCVSLKACVRIVQTCLYLCGPLGGGQVLPTR